MPFSKKTSATFAGILAIIIWSSTVAVSKKVMTELGTYTAAFYIYFFSGLINILILMFFMGAKGFHHQLRMLPFSYYLKTGIFFLAYNIFLYLSIGMSAKDEDLLIVSLLNYLWPVLIVILKIPLNHARIRPAPFWIGIIASVSGIALALFQGYKAEELIKIMRALDDNFLAFLFAFLGAISWALYSNLISRYKTSDDIAAIPIIFIISGLLFFVLLIFRGEIHNLTLTPIYHNPYLVYTILGPTCIGYLFWFLAIKQGNRNLVVSFSYFIPLSSVAFISLLHSIPVRPTFWISAILLVAGAILGLKAVKE